MAESQPDGISTANTNVKIVSNHRLQYEKHDRAITLNGIEEPRDVMVMINRITGEHGSVTGTRRVSEQIAIIYCDNK